MGTAAEPATATARARKEPGARGIDGGVETLTGVGPKVGAALRKAGIETVRDVLLTFPRKYLDERQLAPLGALEEGRHHIVVGTVARAHARGGRARRLVEVTLQSGLEDVAPHGTLRLVWFHGAYGMERRFPTGARLVVRGRVEMYRGQATIVHPSTQVLPEGAAVPLGVRPIYAEVPGVPGGTFARIAQAALKHADGIEELLTRQQLGEIGLTSRSAAVSAVHAPPATLDAETLDAWNRGETPAQMRLSFDDAFLVELCLHQRREEEARHGARVIPPPKDSTEASVLPFALTGAQKRSCEEIARDLARPVPMRRLLQGDVGSGKTAVAMLAALRVARSGHQMAFLVPTEVLAEQHFRSFERVLGPAGVRVALLVGSQRVRTRRSTETALAAGEIDVVIGTHALLAKEAGFRSLALAVVDEQHRFGVGQRLRLVERTDGGPLPHLLIMTATPIPRTLALALYGDLAVSTLDELPPGRIPPLTRIYPLANRQEVLRQVERGLASKGQAYVVCPSIDADEESGDDALASVEATYEEMTARFGAAQVAVVHGGQSADERHASVARFEKGEATVLVATTVVEVGVDVPRANVIVVENAERFGLAQLHQLRGRVGRGGQRSACLLMHGPISDTARERLEVLASTTDGFAIAEADLRLRGPGDLLGRAQSGFALGRANTSPGFAPLWDRAKGLAAAVVKKDSHLAAPEHAAIARAVHALSRTVVREQAG